VPRAGRASDPVAPLARAGEHFYFVDACRYEIDSDDVEITPLGLRFDALTQDPGVFTLFATRRGFAAATTSGFAGHLLDGLAGTSRAKLWDGDDLVVLFRSLDAFVTAKMTEQDVDRRVESRTSGRIRDIRPVPRYRCSVNLQGARTTDEFKIRVVGHRTTTPAVQFVGPRYGFQGTPDDYTVVVESVGGPGREATAQVGLWEDQDVALALAEVGQEAAGRPPAATAAVIHAGTPEVSVELVSRLDAAVRIDVDDQVTTVPAGPYHALISDRRNGRLLAATDVDLTGLGPPVKLHNLTRWTFDDGPRRSLLAQLPDYARHDDAVAFSESVGFIADNDLNVWLAIVGASRIVENPDVWEKIGHLQLFDASGASPGDAPVFVLAAVPPPANALRISLWPDGAAVEAHPVPGLEHVYQAALTSFEGPKLLTIDVEGHPVRTVVTHCLANRGTLVTYSVGEGPDLRQYILPIGHLRPLLRVQDMLLASSARSPLDWVRFAAQCQRAFSNHEAIEPRGPDEGVWRELVDGKGLDPVTGVVAAYELIRAGRSDIAEIAVGNLATYFPSLPDPDHLARALAMAGPDAETPPLVLDGAIANDFTAFQGMGADRLDYRGSWTAWINARPEGPTFRTGAGGGLGRRPRPPSTGRRRAG
jgi:hypothetical protein